MRIGRAPFGQPRKGVAVYISIGAVILILILLVIFVF
jgi:hypothetical protein